MVLEKVADLPYGENPHQRAAFYRETTHRSGALADADAAPRLAADFNNLLDLDAAYRIAADYTAPTVVITKHTDPVGVASARSWSRPTAGPSTPTRSPRSAASWASTGSSTARPPARSPATRTRR